MPAKKCKICGRELSKATTTTLSENAGECSQCFTGSQATSSIEDLVLKGIDAVRKLDVSHWQLGDLACEWTLTHQGSRRECVKEYAEKIHCDFDRLWQHWQVSNAYVDLGTRVPTLPWSHHREIRNREDRVKWLKLASENTWSVRQMMDAIKAAEQESLNSAGPVKETLTTEAENEGPGATGYEAGPEESPAGSVQGMPESRQVVSNRSRGDTGDSGGAGSSNVPGGISGVAVDTTSICPNCGNQECVCPDDAQLQVDVRTSTLSWTHHERIASLNNRDYWLENARANRWSVRQMMDAIKAAEQENSAEPVKEGLTEGEHGRIEGASEKRTSEGDSLDASGKQPAAQTADNEVAGSGVVPGVSSDVHSHSVDVDTTSICPELREYWDKADQHLQSSPLDDAQLQKAMSTPVNTPAPPDEFVDDVCLVVEQIRKLFVKWPPNTWDLIERLPEFGPEMNLLSKLRAKQIDAKVVR